jgi:hypothetical protein
MPALAVAIYGGHWVHQSKPTFAPEANTVPTPGTTVPNQAIAVGTRYTAPAFADTAPVAPTTTVPAAAVRSDIIADVCLLVCLFEVYWKGTFLTTDVSLSRDALLLLCVSNERAATPPIL